ncbi:MAG: FHA domain-containing protein [Anaerolineae bacterium]
MTDLIQQNIRNNVDQILQIVKDNIGSPVIETYKSRLSSAIYLHTIRSILKDVNPKTDTVPLVDDEGLFTHLDLSNWLHLILERWDFFEPALKHLGRGYVKNIKDLRNKWAHHEEIMLRDAREGARASAQLLELLGCAEPLSDLMKIHDALELEIRRMLPDPAGPVLQPNWLISDAQEPVALETDVGGHLDGDTELVGVVDDSALHLEIVHADGETHADKVPLIDERVVIGRSTRAKIKVNDPRVSRVHLLIAKLSALELSVTDLLSANGTTLDGEKLAPNQPTTWKVGQTISVGNTWLILRQGAA